MDEQEHRNYHKLSDFKKVYLGDYPAFISNKLLFDEDDFLKLQAVYLSKRLGVTFPTALKNYAKKPIIPQNGEAEILRNAAIEYIEESLISIKDLMKKHYFDKQKITAIENFCGNVLTRLEVSYDISLFLSKEGYNYEPKSIFRQILETLNFVFLISAFDEFDEENLTDFCKKNKIKNSNISKFSSFYKWAHIGKIYGELSLFSHLDDKVQGNMMDFASNTILLRHYKFINYNLFFLIILVEINQVVIEYAFRRQINEFEFLESSTLQLKSFPTFKKFSQYEEFLASIT